MKILIVFNHPAPYKVDLFNELSKKIDMEVVFERQACRNRPATFYADKKYKFTYRFLKRGTFGEENSNSNELVKHLKKHHQDYDLIVMNGYSTITEMKAIRYLNKHKIKWCLFVNGGVVKKDYWLKFKVKQFLISNANYYLSPSEKVDEYLLHYGAKKEDIYHYPNSTIYASQIISKPLAEEEKKTIRKEYGLPETFLYISPAQFINRKNNLALIKLFANRKEHLLLIGDGLEKQSYLTFIEENHLTNVTIHHFLDKKSLLRVMSCADAFITLSKEDIYGHTVNEAMSQGLAVITSEKVISSHKLVKNGVNGYIVPLYEEALVLKAMDSLTPLMGEKSIEIARENTIEKMSASIIEALKEMKQK